MSTWSIILTVIIVLALAAAFIVDVIYIIHQKRQGRNTDSCTSCYKGKAMLADYQAKKKRQRKAALKFKRELERADRKASTAR